MSEADTLRRARIFARYSYVPEPNWAILRIFADDEFASSKRDLARMTPADQIRHVRAAADALQREAFSTLQGDIIIPLSGGRDSRFVLCLAIDSGLKDRIQTVTWGVPGGLDWEISAKVAGYFGVPHQRIDTCGQPITLADLRLAFEQGARWSDLIFAHFNQRWRTIAPPTAIGLIGYLGGGPIGSASKVEHEALGLAGAIAAFERRNCLVDRGASVITHAAHQLLNRSRMNLPDQLDLAFRQEGYLRRVIASPQLNVRTPFANHQWLRAMYALPIASRDEGALFASFLDQRFPKAYAIGTSSGYGLRLNAPNWQHRVARQLTRARNAAMNTLDPARAATLDKYGAEHRLLECLRDGLGVEDDPSPRSLERIVNTVVEPGRSAMQARLRAMLMCNLLFDRETSEQSARTSAA